MSIPKPSFTVGIEEEYLLVDLDSFDLVSDPPKELMADCERVMGGHVTSEFLRSQIEVGTRVCKTVREARNQLAELRRTISRIAAQYNAAPIAASTHPFARWSAQHYTDKDRYRVLAQDMQVVARRLVICGMHIHAGIEDDDLRMDLLTQTRYFLPHILALTTSSPFWQGQNTGLKSYRLSVFDELPRTGMPAHFNSFGEYKRTVDVLISAGLIEDASKVWWDLRPHHKFPTNEMRIADVCTFVDDAATVAALFVCTCRMLYRLRRENQRWRTYPVFLLNENRWRAQRYGTDQGLVDFGKGEIVSVSNLMEELIVLLEHHAREADCIDELLSIREILTRGTSADRQLALFKRACSEGASEHEALKAVVRQLIEETMARTDVAS